MERGSIDYTYIRNIQVNVFVCTPVDVNIISNCKRPADKYTCPSRSGERGAGLSVTCFWGREREGFLIETCRFHCMFRLFCLILGKKKKNLHNYFPCIRCYYYCQGLIILVLRTVIRHTQELRDRKLRSINRYNAMIFMILPPPTRVQEYAVHLLVNPRKWAEQRK